MIARKSPSRVTRACPPSRHATAIDRSTRDAWWPLRAKAYRASATRSQSSGGSGRRSRPRKRSLKRSNSAREGAPERTSARIGPVTATDPPARSRSSRRTAAASPRKKLIQAEVSTTARLRPTTVTGPRDVDVEPDPSGEAAELFPLRLPDQLFEPGDHRFGFRPKTGSPTRFLQSLFREIEGRSHVSSIGYGQILCKMLVRSAPIPKNVGSGCCEKQCEERDYAG